MFRLLTILMLIGSLTNCAQYSHSPINLSSKQQDQASLQLVTAIPVLHSMADILASRSKINTHYLPPERYSIKRVPGWLKRQSPAELLGADIVLGMPSVWPKVDIYPYLRSQNIKVIPIDAAQALVPGGERVAIAPVDNNVIPYFWLDPANALLMLGIIHRDLISILRSSAYDETTINQQIQVLEENFQKASVFLRKIQIDMNEILSDLNLMQVIVDKEDFSALASATLLPIVSLEESLQGSIPSILITAKSAKHQSLQGLPEHVVVWSIDDFSKKHNHGFLWQWEANLLNLKNISIELSK